LYLVSNNFYFCLYFGRSPNTVVQASKSLTLLSLFIIHVALDFVDMCCCVVLSHFVGTWVDRSVKD